MGGLAHTEEERRHLGVFVVVVGVRRVSVGCQGGCGSRRGGSTQAVVAMGDGDSGKTAGGEKTRWRAE